MKILFHCAYFQRMAGANRSFLELIENLDRSRYHSVTVFSSDGPVPQHYRTKGMQVVIFPIPKALNLFDKILLRYTPVQKLRLILFDLVPFTLRFARYIRRERFDIIHCRDPRSLLLIGLASRLAGKPVICHIRGDLPSSFPLKLFIGIVSHCIVLVNQYLMLSIPVWFRKKCTVVHNSIGASTFPTVFENHTMTYDTVDVAYHIVLFANVLKAKGIETLIEAAQLSKKRGRSDIVFHVIGDTGLLPEYFTYVEGYVKSHTLPVCFEGWHDDTISWYRRAYIVVLPTFSEGLPRTLLEAMFFGKPVIASRVGGIPELVVDDVTGFLVEAGDAPMLYKKIEILVDDPDRARIMGIEGKRRVEACFSTERMLGKMMSIYDQYDRMKTVADLKL